MAYLTHQALDPAELLREITAPERGGVATFLGLVRNHHQGDKVIGLHYTAYEPMAEAVCAEIVAEAAAKWPVTVGLRHRLGELAVGDIAVAVAAAGDHRDEAFSACRYVIEELKARVPIWKQERYADGTVDWVSNSGGGLRDAGCVRPAK